MGHKLDRPRRKMSGHDNRGDFDHVTALVRALEELVVLWFLLNKWFLQMAVGKILEKWQFYYYFHIINKTIYWQGCDVRHYALVM
jgi:hypothetical protein